MNHQSHAAILFRPVLFLLLSSASAFFLACAPSTAGGICNCDAGQVCGSEQQCFDVCADDTDCPCGSCASGQCTLPADGTSCGMPTAPAPTTVDGTSDCDEHEDCAAGRFCSGQGACLPQGEVGATCDVDQHCLSDDCLDGACFEKKPLGDACQSDVECESNRCHQSACRADGALWVDAIDGNDSAVGNVDAPFLTIQKAIDISYERSLDVDVANDVPTVWVKKGTYKESLVLHEGVSLLAHEPSTSADEKKNQDDTALDVSKTKATTELGSHVVTGVPALYAENIQNVDSRVSGFAFRSLSGTAARPSSVAVVLINTAALVFENNLVRAGSGFDGEDGLDGSAGSQPSASAHGKRGEDGGWVSCNTAPNDDGSGSGCGIVGSEGALGGTSSCGAPSGYMGGDGGGDGSASSDNGHGQRGLPSSGSFQGGARGRFGECYQAVDSCYYEPGTACSPWECIFSECAPCVAKPGDGRNGVSGFTGTAGFGGSGLGFWDGDRWTTPAGLPGQIGTHGRPGTGGGGAGGYNFRIGDFYYGLGGSGGGGGGAGGCRGNPGLEGTGGGASIAIYLEGSLPALVDNDIAASSGGQGGRGGLGGDGVKGGSGGAGGESDHVYRNGGEGGFGGRGGDGGAAGGGVGGSSVAIAVKSTQTVPDEYAQHNEMAVGVAGVGGLGDADVVGTHGADGTALEVYVY